MSNTISLLQNNHLIKNNYYEEELFNHILKAFAKKYNKKDYMVQEYVDMKTSTIEMIEKSGFWKRTRNGFINRSDFKYNGREIIYQTNTIRRLQGEYIITSDSNNKAKKEFASQSKLFILLGKIETVLDGFYQDHKEEIDTTLKYYMGSPELKEELDPEIIKEVGLRPLKPSSKRKAFENIRLENQYIGSMFNQYGGILTHRIITILNELDEVEDIEQYAKDFAKSYAPLATLVPEDKQDSTLSPFASIPYILTRIISFYSIRGNQFKKIVKQELDKYSGYNLSFDEPSEQNGLTNM